MGGCGVIVCLLSCSRAVSLGAGEPVWGAHPSVRHGRAKSSKRCAAARWRGAQWLRRRRAATTQTASRRGAPPRGGAAGWAGPPRKSAGPAIGRCARRRCPVLAHSDDRGERPAGHRRHGGGRQALLPGGLPQAKHWWLEGPCGRETSQCLVRRSLRPRDRAVGELSFSRVPLEASCTRLCWCHVGAVARSLVASSLVARSCIENLAEPVHARATRGQSTASSPQLVRPGGTARSPWRPAWRLWAPIVRR